MGDGKVMEDPDDDPVVANPVSNEDDSAIDISDWGVGDGHASAADISEWI